MTNFKKHSFKLAAAGAIVLTGLLAPVTANASIVSGNSFFTFDNTGFAASNSYGDTVKKYWGASDNLLGIDGATTGGTTLSDTGSTGPLSFLVNTNITTISHPASGTFGRTEQATSMDSGNTSVGQIGLSGALRLNNATATGLVTPYDFSLLKTAGIWNIRTYDTAFGYQNIWKLDNVSESLNVSGELLLSGDLKWTGLWSTLVGANTSVVGTFNLAPVSAVPVPAAFWLFGSGVLGLTGFGRKKLAMAV